MPVADPVQVVTPALIPVAVPGVVVDPAGVVSDPVPVDNSAYIVTMDVKDVKK